MMEPACGFCKCRGCEEELGQLYHTNIRGKIIAAHHRCMQYSAGLSQFKFDHFGGFNVDEVDAELKRGAKLRCNACRVSGATAGCCVRSCRRSYHFPCAPRHERMEVPYGRDRQKMRVLYRIFCTKEHEKNYKETPEDVDSSSDNDSAVSDTENRDKPDGKTKKRGSGKQRGRPKKKLCESPVESNKSTGGKTPKLQRGLPPGRLRKKSGVGTLTVRLPAVKRSSTSPVVKVNIRPSARRETTPRLEPTTQPPVEATQGTSSTDHKIDDVGNHYKPKKAYFLKQNETIVTADVHQERRDSESSEGSAVSDDGEQQGSERSDSVRDRATGSDRDTMSQIGQPVVVKTEAAEPVMTGDTGTGQGGEPEPRPSKVKSRKLEGIVRKIKKSVTRSPEKQSSKDRRPSEIKDHLSSRLGDQNVDGTQVDIPTPEASGSETNERKFNYTDHGSEHHDIQRDKDSVVLLIPSLLNVEEADWAGLYTDIGISPTRSVVWPPIDRQGHIQDKHLPHFMLDIVTCIRENKWDKVQSILINADTDKYDYLLKYFEETGPTKDLIAQYLSKVADKLQGVSHRTAFFMSSESKNVTFLVLFLSHHVPEQSNILSSLTPPVYAWSHGTSINRSASPDRTEEELELLWRWLIGQIRTGFHSVSYPRLSSACPIEKLLYDDNCSCEVVKELSNNLSDLEKTTGNKTGALVDIIAINGVNRLCVKYKHFVRQLINSMTEESDSSQLYFIVSVDQSDDLVQAGDILPDHLSGAASIYSAFNPQTANISCFVVHIDMTECINTDRQADTQIGAVSEGAGTDTVSDVASEGSCSSVASFQESENVGFSIVKTEGDETMLFHPVDSEWQREKAELLGIKVKTPIPQCESCTIPRSTVPKEVVNIRKDGNCFFRAISHILTGNQREHKLVRQMIYKFMIENDSVFSKLANCPNYADSVSMNIDGEWATEIEIFATATMLATDLCVYSPCGHDTRGKTIYKWLTYRPLRNVSPLEGIRRLRNASKWLTYKHIEHNTSTESYRKHRKTIYLSNIDDHYIPIYRLGDS